MSFDQLLRTRIRPLLVWGGVVPALLLVVRIFTGGLGPNPAEELEHSTGFTALWLQIGSLSMTPLRKLTGRAAFTALRKPLGLWAFGYALLHFLCWLVFDQSLLLGEIWYDIRKRPYITVGFTAFLILATLAATTPARVARRLGGKRWQQVHRLAYLAATLAVLHFLWLVKRDVTRPVVAGIVVIALLALRLDRVVGGSKRRPLSSGT
ncbi:MAG TPA: protein-methionine-sulfoxide reductase heme-binding subunit MsrQ [Gemmatimonadales bacterium]|nr:protein-methionine-sulfoxide reductase heme-binding subunit MsrQ [Gemmatimonadales bacterium]